MGALKSVVKLDDDLRIGELAKFLGSGRKPALMSLSQVTVSTCLAIRVLFGKISGEVGRNTRSQAWRGYRWLTKDIWSVVKHRRPARSL